jgi:hypothetical protein
MLAQKIALELFESETLAVAHRRRAHLLPRSATCISDVRTSSMFGPQSAPGRPAPQSLPNSDEEAFARQD